MFAFKKSKPDISYWYTPTLMSRLTKEEEDSAEDEDVAEDFGSALLELSALEEDVSFADEDGLSVADEDGLSVEEEDVGSLLADEEDSLEPEASLEEETSLLEDSSSLIEDEDSRMSNSSRETFKEELSLQAVNRAAPHKERSANFFMVRI
jgi:hypothetical protein